MAEPTEPRPTGRPTKRTPEIEKSIFRALSVGLSYENAAKIVLLSPSTLDAWMAADESFRAACESSRASLGQTCAAALLKAALKGNVTAAIFLLKVRMPEFREPKEYSTVVNVARGKEDERYL